MLAFVHYVNTPNIGDLSCAPYLYFNFKGAKVFDLSADVPQCEAVIYGGGAIEPKLRSERIHDRVEATSKIAWGIGTSRRGKQEHGPLIEGLDLCGVREFGREKGKKNTYYVPCVSCMSPLFDKSFEIKHEVVFYTHGVHDLIDSQDLPRMNNRASTLEEAISFIGSGEVVVTNSFHGTYWATLLGRKVVCVPFSSKFYGFKFAPSYCLDGKWKEASLAARNHSEALDDSRDANLKFYDRVRSLISSRRRKNKVA